MAPLGAVSCYLGGLEWAIPNIIHAVEKFKSSRFYLLQKNYLSISLFTNDVVLLASSPEGLQRQLNALALFCDLRQLMINLGKTKVMIFNESKKSIDLHFFFRGKEIEITNTYTYLGVQFYGPASVRDRPSSLESPRDTNLYPFSRDSVSVTTFRTSHPRCPSWTPLSDPRLSMAKRFGGLRFWSDWALVERV
jgi:hypothetical protein